MLIDLIVGARPNFMKIAPIIKEIDSRPDCGLKYRLIHTGQHYDKKMSGDFFTQLGIPAPDINLEVGSGTQAEQTANIMVKYEAVLTANPSDLCLVVGDVTSTMACAITAQKMQIPVAHVEAGIRSGDWTMPEEINRLVTDSITNWFFTTSEIANDNLRKNGVSEDRIFFVGNTMIDTLLQNMDKFYPPECWKENNLTAKEYFVLTLHRPANVDKGSSFEQLIQAIGEAARNYKVIFPVHPRTAKTIKEMGFLPENIILVEPLPYLEFNYLVQHSLAVITDSGGITEESTVMNIPCITLRDNTERPETVTIGTNVLAGTNPNNLKPLISKIIKKDWHSGSIPENWDGLASKRIIDKINQLEITNDFTTNK